MSVPLPVFFLSFLSLLFSFFLLFLSSLLFLFSRSPCKFLVRRPPPCRTTSVRPELNCTKDEQGSPDRTVQPQTGKLCQFWVVGTFLSFPGGLTLPLWSSKGVHIPLYTTLLECRIGIGGNKSYSQCNSSSANVAKNINKVMSGTPRWFSR